MRNCSLIDKRSNFLVSYKFDSALIAQKNWRDIARVTNDSMVVKGLKTYFNTNKFCLDLFYWNTVIISVTRGNLSNVITYHF